MNKMKKLIAATAALTLSAPLFAADYSIDELAAEGAAVVRVQQVLANCEQGEPRILFNDQTGALLHVEELANVDVLLNAHAIAQKGGYSNLHVVLADEGTVSRNGRTELVALRQGLNGTVLRLDGELQVSRNFVGGKGIVLGQHQHSKTLASIKPKSRKS